MYMTTEEQREKKPPGKSLFGRVKLILLVSSFLGLGSLNIATLINDQLHTASYSVLQRVLGAALTDATLEKFLSHSPSVERKRDVAVATEVLRAEKTQLTSRNHELTSSNHKLTNKHAELERSHKDISTKHTDLKATNIKQAAVAKNISQKIAERSAKTATRNIASLGGEAIPFLGTALILGVTAWDIYDLCETLKDINQINQAFGHPLENQQAICGREIPTKAQVMASVTDDWQGVYKSAAKLINQAGKTMVSPSPPDISWSQMKTLVCPVIGAPSTLCP